MIVFCDKKCGHRKGNTCGSNGIYIIGGKCTNYIATKNEANEVNKKYQQQADNENEDYIRNTDW